MEFTFDVSQTPLIGRRILLKTDTESSSSSSSNPNLQAKNGQNQAPLPTATHLPHTGTPNSPRRSASLSPADTVPLSGWKRPWMSQGRVRECLVNLLTTCGQRVGLPKSPSVSSQRKFNINYLIFFILYYLYYEHEIKFHVLFNNNCAMLKFNIINF